MKRTCIQCGKEFELTNSEIGFYKKRKLSLPKRCKECREKNRANSGRGTGEKKNDRQPGAEKSSQYVPKTEKVSQFVEKTAASSQKDQKQPKKSLGSKLITLLLLAAAGVYAATSGISDDSSAVPEADQDYEFRSEKLFEEHYEKHGIEMGFETAEAYLEAANDVIDDPDVLHKTEEEDGDDVYFLEDTNEFVVVSTDGYIRTYFEPEDGIEYFERQ